MAKRLPGDSPDWLAHESFARSLSGEGEDSNAAIERHLKRVSAELHKQRPRAGQGGAGAPHPGAGPGAGPGAAAEVRRRPGSALTERERVRRSARADAEAELQEMRRAAEKSAAEAAALRRKLVAVERQIAMLAPIVEADLDTKTDRDRAAEPGNRRAAGRRGLSIASVLAVAVLAGLAVAWPRSAKTPEVAGESAPAASQDLGAGPRDAGAEAAAAALAGVAERPLAQEAAQEAAPARKLAALQQRSVRAEPALIAPQAEDAAQTARLKAELATAKSELARLANQLALRNEASADATAQRIDLAKRALAAGAEAKALKAELAAARRQIADQRTAIAVSEAGAARTAARLARSDEAVAEAQAARLAVAETAGAAGGERPSASESAHGPPGAIAAVQTTAGSSASQTAGTATRLRPPVNLAAWSDGPPFDAPGETAPAEQVIANPAAYRGRTVIVTGSLVHELWQYRLRSDNKSSSLVVNVERLPDSALRRLEAARRSSAPPDALRVRIRGRVERDTYLTYRLAAAELDLIE